MLVGIPAVREGNIILLPTARLEVAEACSGIRSLFSLITLTVIYGYLAETKVSLRVLLVLMAVPISVLANALRIAVTGVVVEYWGIEGAQGTIHLLSGWLIFAGSLALVFLLHRFSQGAVLYPGRGRSAGGIRMNSWNARITIVTLLLAGTALFLQARARSEFVLPQTALATFPVELQNWVGTDVFLDDESLKPFAREIFCSERTGTRTAAQVTSISTWRIFRISTRCFTTCRRIVWKAQAGRRWSQEQPRSRFPARPLSRPIAT